MCGIVGVVAETVGQMERSAIEAMIPALCKRGPDDSGCIIFPNCVLGHTRLSILDLATGHQPMQAPDKKIAITFNGEIYNFQELKGELERQGHCFETRSDTEVILQAYLEYGTECPKYLDGMFAFAIWDQRKNSLFMARDRFGKKPLYYALDSSGRFWFASEIKALLRSNCIESQIDLCALDYYLRWAHIPPMKTAYQHIHTLPPAHSMLYSNRKITTQRYWSLEHKPLSISYPQAKEEVRFRLKEAVRKRMVADVEIGALLSGGVDSTLVTHFAQEVASRPIKTFSVGYGDHINELPYSHIASTKIGTDHHVLQVDGAELPDDLQSVVRYFDEPHADSSNISQFLVSALAQKKVKVALCGDGGDELFLGYDWYQSYSQIPLHKRIVQRCFSDPLLEFLKIREVFSADERRLLWRNGGSDDSDPLISELTRSWLPPETKINLFDLGFYLPGQLLVKADRAGMMNSLELRSPLLDYGLAEFVYNLPLKFKLNHGRGKIILKDILAEFMPREFVDRKKQGFGAPVREWLKRDRFKALACDFLGGSDASIHTLFDRANVRSILEDFYSKNRPNHHKIWVLLCLELWMQAIKSPSG